jgi:benzoyl-CoA reductase subunit C
MPSPLAILQHHYEQPLITAQDARKSGVGVVGITGPTVPIELAMAVRLCPVRISPVAGQATPTADHYMDNVIAPDTKSLFESAIRGDFEFLDLLVLTRHDDKLYYYLKELLRLGRARSLPPLHMFDLMGSQREAVRLYNEQHFDGLIRALERVSGRAVTDAALREAIDITNRSRALQRQLQQWRWQGQLAGTEALQVVGASFHMDPAVYAQALAGYMDDRARIAPKPIDGPRVVVITSEPLSHLSLHRYIEQQGGLVVAEDDHWGSRAPGNDPPTNVSPREGLFRKYWLDTAHAGVYPREAREAWFMEAFQRPDVDGVVFYVPPGDRQFGWDYPRLAKRVTDAGKQAVLLRKDARVDPTIAAPIAQFLTELRALRRTA